MVVSANRLELLQIADAVAREKNIDREIVIEAIEEAIQKGAKSRYGAHHDIRAKIDHKTGELSLTRHVTIVADDWMPEDELEEFNDSAMVRLRDAQKRDPGAEVGKEYVEQLPPFEFGRVQTQMAPAQPRQHPAAWCAGDKALLHQIGLDHLLDGVAAFRQSG